MNLNIINKEDLKLYKQLMLEIYQKNKTNDLIN